jgi:hypothetical protein
MRNTSALWYCCACQSGPYLRDLYPACISCHHEICERCEGEADLVYASIVRSYHLIMGINMAGMDDSSDSSSENETTLSAESSPDPEDLADPESYHGPLLGFKTDALFLLVGAYEQSRPAGCPNSGDNDKSHNRSNGGGTSEEQKYKQGETSEPKWTKRAGLGRNNDEKEGGEDDKRKRQRFTGREDLGNERLLACPFCKFNPRKYRSCYKVKLSEISRLKYVNIHVAVF